MHLTIKDNLKQAQQAFKEFEKSVQTKVVPQALNKVIVTVKTDTKRTISKITGIKQNRIESRLNTGKASRANPVASINAKDAKASNLSSTMTTNQIESIKKRQRIKRKGKHITQGVTAKPYNKRTLHKGAFVGSGRGNGKQLVFARTGSGRNSKLKALFGPSVRHEFSKANNHKRMKAKAQERMNIELNRAIANQVRLAERRSRR